MDIRRKFNVGVSTELPTKGMMNGDTFVCTDIRETITYIENKWYRSNGQPLDALLEGTFDQAKQQQAKGIKKGFRFYCKDKGTGNGLFIEYVSPGVWIDGAGNLIV